MKHFFTLAVAALFATILTADRSEALDIRPFEITVGGTSYLIDFYSGNVNDRGYSWEEYTTANTATFPSTPVLQRGLLTPWYTSIVTAKAFADAFIAQVSTNPNPIIPGDGEAYAFGFQEFSEVGIDADTGNIVTKDFINTVAAVYDSASNDMSISDAPLQTDLVEGFGLDDATRKIRWAYVVDPTFQRPVPEIDGPVLVQVGFALMGLYVLMLGRRRREDDISGTQLAA